MGCIESTPTVEPQKNLNNTNTLQMYPATYYPSTTQQYNYPATNQQYVQQYNYPLTTQSNLSNAPQPSAPPA